VDPASATAALFVVNIDGMGLRRLTLWKMVAGNPDWAPDGSVIGFNDKNEGPPTQNDIYVIEPDGTGLRNVTHGLEAASFMPTWSPDGGLILFASWPMAGSFDLYTIEPDGGSLTRIAEITEAATPTKFEDTGPQWSPDGTHLVFQRWNKATGQFAVFTIRLDGTHPRRLTPWRLNAGDHPDWSPDGRWIMFHSQQDQDRQDNVFLVHPNGTGMHRITNTFGGKYRWFSSSFSSDGTMIAVARAPGIGNPGNADVYVIKVDGTGPS
jgi:Tol biopolymer transport system component